MSGQKSTRALDITPEEFEERMRTILDVVYYSDTKSETYYDRRLHQEHVRFASASLGPPIQVTYYATVAAEMTNKNGTLHGGCAATLIDVLTSTILLGLGQSGKFSLGGITRALDLKFLRAVPEGVEVAIVCEVVHIGRRLALLKAEIRRRDTGDVCVVGEHDKANTDPVEDAKI